MKGGRDVQDERTKTAKAAKRAEDIWLCGLRGLCGLLSYRAHTDDSRVPKPRNFSTAQTEARLEHFTRMFAEQRRGRPDGGRGPRHAHRRSDDPDSTRHRVFAL